MPTSDDQCLTAGASPALSQLSLLTATHRKFTCVKSMEETSVKQ